MHQLFCNYQNYDWGKIGPQSMVYKICSLTQKDLDQSKPYAELWMGSHDSCPSFIENTKLSDFIKQDAPKYLGKTIDQFKVAQLPYLFKVLSVQKSLSIQAHPNKKLAEQLFESFPNIYKDANYKPEMALTLTKFEALSNFRPFNELVQQLENNPILLDIFGLDLFYAFRDSQNVDQQQQNLRQLIIQLTSTSEDSIRSHVRNLVQSIQENKLKDARNDLVIRLNEQFPDDIGILFQYFLNYIQLEPGSCFFMDADEPHAYISGDILECMASSDNVVRLGLTPKFKDKETLVKMLTYQMKSPNILHGQHLANTQNHGYEHVVYKSDFYREFQCVKIGLPPHQQELITGFITYEYPTIFIVIQGKGHYLSADQQKEIEEGQIYFVSPYIQFQFKNSANNNLILYMCTSH